MIKPSVNKAKNAALQALAILLGLSAGKVAMMFAGGKIPAMAVPLLGALGFVPHFTNSDAFLKDFGTGVITAGGIDGLQKLTAGKSGVMGQLNMYLPALNSTTIVAAAPANGGGTAGMRGLGNPDVYARVLNGVGNTMPPQYAMLVN